MCIWIHMWITNTAFTAASYSTCNFHLLFFTSLLSIFPLRLDQYVRSESRSSPPTRFHLSAQYVCFSWGEETKHKAAGEAKWSWERESRSLDHLRKNCLSHALTSNNQMSNNEDCHENRLSIIHCAFESGPYCNWITALTTASTSQLCCLDQ